MRSSTVQFRSRLPDASTATISKRIVDFVRAIARAQTLLPRAASASACAHRRLPPAPQHRDSAGSSPRRTPAVSPSIATRSISAPAARKFRCNDPIAIAPQILLRRPLAPPPERKLRSRSAPEPRRPPGQSTRAASSYPMRPHSREARRPHQPLQAFLLPVQGSPLPRKCETTVVSHSMSDSDPDMVAECYDSRRIIMAEAKITVEQVRHVARLARLELSPTEEQRLRADMDEMLAYVDKLNELDTDRRRANDAGRRGRHADARRRKSPTSPRPRRCWRTRRRASAATSKCPK